jgi:uncharacterized protein YqhQ
MSSTKKPSVGGEALLEGVMMRGPDKMAIAIRKPDGEIIVETNPVTPASQKSKITRLPVVRGAISMVDSMVVGIKAIMYSAEFIEIEDDVKTDEPEKPAKKMSDAWLIFAVIIGLIFGIGLFMVIPYAISRLPEWIGGSTVVVSASTTTLMNLAEGVVRIVLFVLYIMLISRIKDVSRVFQYHGAEHKSIFCYESGQDLTVENARRFTTRHPRCGTAFLFIVMLISILVFSIIGKPTIWLNITLRIVLIPLIAGLAYEVIKFSGRNDSIVMKIVSAPGLWMQRFTTREPDDGQLEVALAALKNVVWTPEQLEAEASEKAALAAAEAAEAAEAVEAEAVMTAQPVENETVE